LNPSQSEAIDRPFSATATAQHRFLFVKYRGEFAPNAEDFFPDIFTFLGVKFTRAICPQDLSLPAMHALHLNSPAFMTQRYQMNAFLFFFLNESHDISPFFGRITPHVPSILSRLPPMPDMVMGSGNTPGLCLAAAEKTVGKGVCRSS
jgi:hypothetical protein